MSGAAFDFDQLYAAHARAVLAYCRSHVGDAGEDVAQDVWARVWARRSQCQTKPRAWLWAVMRSRVIEYYRRRGNVPGDELPDTPAPSPYPALEARIDLQRISDQVLTDSQRRAVSLYLRGDAVPTLARVQFHRAVKRARRMLSEQQRSVTQ